MVNSKFKKFLRPTELQEIIYLSAEKNYTIFHFRNGKELRVSTNLGKIEKEFCNNLDLMRIHLSYIVNVNYINEIYKIEGFLRLYNKAVIPINLKYLDNLKKLKTAVA